MRAGDRRQNFFSRQLLYWRGPLSFEALLPRRCLWHVLLRLCQDFRLSFERPSKSLSLKRLPPQAIETRVVSCFAHLLKEYLNRRQCFTHRCSGSQQSDEAANKLIGRVKRKPSST